MALRLIENICGDDINKWQSVEETAIKSLEKRIKLWDGILMEIMRKKAIA
jgi:hypothetical protein